MAVAARGGTDRIAGVVFHTDRGSTYTAEKFTALCRRLEIRQSMGRVGSCFDNAAAEAFFSSLEWEVLSRHQFATTAQARATVIDWCYGFYKHQRRHSAARAPRAPGALSARPPPASLRSPHALRASVMNRAATAASTAEARTVKPAVRKTVCKVVDETRMAPRPEPTASAI